VERRACQSYLEEELRIFLPRLRAIVALGGLAWDQVSRVLRDVGLPVPRPRPPFRHGGEVWISSPGLRDENGGETEAGADLKESRSLVLLGSYHPSQQNTFTGRLTEAMFDDVWSRARDLVS
jgi:uracil-DNA glycosylase